MDVYAVDGAKLSSIKARERDGEGVARWPNYPYAIKVIKAIIRGVKRLRGNASSGRMGCWHEAWPVTQQQAQGTGMGRGTGTGTTYCSFLFASVITRVYSAKKELKFVETFTFFNLYEEQWKLLLCRGEGQEAGARSHAIIWTILVLNANICLNGIIVQ